MNENICNNILSTIERKLMDVGRLIQNEEHGAAYPIIQTLKQNLLRIEDIISYDTFQTIDVSLENLKQICEEHPVNNEGRVDAYAATKFFSGRPGRPKLNITREQIELLLKENYTARQMAQVFGCSTKLIYTKCYTFGIKLRQKYFNGNEEVLYENISNLHTEFPNSGSQMMTSYLQTRGFLVQRQRVRTILTRIDPVGTACRWASTVQRRTYKVPTPNSLWHMDAHLKLIRWKFAVHGCIDGYSRLILYLGCATSMTADTVVPFFASAVVEYGLPSRVRSDFGYENLFVAMIMNAIRGLNRGSHITGRSVHNQRIERLWVDVYNQVIDNFYNEFYNLERDGLLNIDNETNMFALHKVYLPCINENLALFMNAWNVHKIRTAGRKTPKQLWLSGMLENINSDHTAPSEIFGEQQDLYSRVVSAFGIEELNEDAVILPENISQQQFN